MKRKHGLRVVLILLVIAVAGFGVFSYLNRSAGDLFNEVTAQRQDIETFYTFSGNLEASDAMVYVATSRGTVKELLLEEGDAVKEDDYVITPKSGSKLKAPMDGTISDIYVEVDDVYAPGTQLFRVADYNHPEVTIKVDEYDVDAIEKGMTVTVNVHAVEAELDGVVKRIAQEATVVNDVAYYEVVIEVPQDGSLRMGMTCEIVVPRESVEDAVTVPVDAIQYDDRGKPYVYCYNREDKVVTQSVLLGINDGSVVEVTDGISSGETILVPKSMFGNLPMMQMMRSR